MKQDDIDAVRNCKGSKKGIPEGEFFCPYSYVLGEEVGDFCVYLNQNRMLMRGNELSGIGEYVMSGCDHGIKGDDIVSEMRHYHL